MMRIIQLIVLGPPSIILVSLVVSFQKDNDQTIREIARGEVGLLVIALAASFGKLYNPCFDMDYIDHSEYGRPPEWIGLSLRDAILLGWLGEREWMRRYHHLLE